MKVIYDLETDTLTMIFKDMPITESDELREGLIVDYDANGRVVSIEVLSASENISDPKSILYELKEAKISKT